MSAISGTPDFRGLRVLTLESRRATEIATLIRTYGGDAVVAPALREVPLESNTDVLEFAAALFRGELDFVIFLTGVGARAVVDVVEREYPRDAFVQHLSRTTVIARGPKPLAVLRELHVPVSIAVPEPNTWRELLAAIDARAGGRPLRGARVAVQEYGVSNTELLDGLTSRGAVVMRVPVYRWALPDDIAPLQDAVHAVGDGRVDVIVFTTGVQVQHLWQVARDMNLEAALRRGFGNAVIGSIGPTTSEELRRRGMDVDLEASHPKFGILIRELATQSTELVQAKRARA